MEVCRKLSADMIHYHLDTSGNHHGCCRSALLVVEEWELLGQQPLLGWYLTWTSWSHKTAQILGSHTRHSTSQSSQKSRKGRIFPGVWCKLRSPALSPYNSTLIKNRFPSVQAGIWVVWVSTDLRLSKTSSLIVQLSIQLRIRVLNSALVIKVQKVPCCPASPLCRVGCFPSVSFWPH